MLEKNKPPGGLIEDLRYKFHTTGWLKFGPVGTCPDDKRSAIATLARKQDLKVKQIITRLEPIPNTPQGGY